MNRSAQRLSRQAGFTLIEVCVALGVSAALLGQAVPSMSRLQAEQKLRAQTDTFRDDFRFAGSEARRLNANITINFGKKGGSQCYVLHSGQSNDCECTSTGAAVCKNGAQAVRTVAFPDSQSVRLSSNASSIVIQALQGRVASTASIDFSLDNGPAIRQVIAITGRVRACTSAGNLAGLKACPKG